MPPFHRAWLKHTTSPNDKILDLSNLKAFTDNKINVTQKLISALGMVETIEGKGENAGYQHFLLFPHNVFKRLISLYGNELTVSQ